MMWREFVRNPFSFIVGCMVIATFIIVGVATWVSDRRTEDAVKKPCNAFANAPAEETPVRCYAQPCTELLDWPAVKLPVRCTGVGQ